MHVLIVSIGWETVAEVNEEMKAAGISATAGASPNRSWNSSCRRGVNPSIAMVYKLSRPMHETIPRVSAFTPPSVTKRVGTPSSVPFDEQHQGGVAVASVWSGSSISVEW